jgi:hemolysin III
VIEGATVPAAWTPPSYTRREKLADAVVHGLGLGAALAACIALALAAPAEGWITLALGAYAAGLVAMLLCSALYNLAPPGPRKALLRRLDHAAIFVMIAGTYTPIAAIAIGGAWAWGLLGLVWTGAAGGVVLKLAGPMRLEKLSVAAYLLLGWFGLVALHRLLEALPAADFALLLAGGVLYSLGVVFHLSTRLRYHNAIWHGFVLAAAACHFTIVLRLAAAAEG